MHLKTCNKLQGSGQQCKKWSLYHVLLQGAFPRGAGFQCLLLACLGPHQDAPHVRWGALGLWPPRLLHGALGLSVHGLALMPAAPSTAARPEAPCCGRHRMLAGCSGASLCAVRSMHGRGGECSLGRSSSAKLLRPRLRSCDSNRPPCLFRETMSCIHIKMAAGRQVRQDIQDSSQQASSRHTETMPMPLRLASCFSCNSTGVFPCQWFVGASLITAS